MPTPFTPDPGLPSALLATHPRQFTRVLATAGTKVATAYACLLNWTDGNDYCTLHTFTDYASSEPDFKVNDHLTISVTDTVDPVADFDAIVTAIDTSAHTVTLRKVGAIAFVAASLDDFQADPDGSRFGGDPDILQLLSGTIPANWISGQAVTVALTTGGSTLPEPLAEETTYYLIIHDSVNIGLATSQANAIAGTAINLTTEGDNVTVSLQNYTRNVTATLHLPFRSATIYGKKAAQTDNVSDLQFGAVSGSNAQPQTILAGGSTAIDLENLGGLGDLADWSIETGTNADGFVAELYR